MHSAVVTLVPFVLLVCSAAQPFSYENQTAWPSLPGSHCGGSRQSPIDIGVSQTTTNRDLRRLQLTGWNESVSGTLLNTGSSLKFTPASSNRNAVFTTHRGEYTLAQFHFHWGNRTGEGSEHLINGKSYEAEIHFVHARTQPPSSGTEGDAFSVVGILLTSSQTSPRGTVWEKFLNVPQVVRNINISVVYNEFLPSDLSYYYYEGSLTTPPCIEVVQWIVLQNTVPIPEEVLRSLRSAPANVNATILETRTYRDPQPLNGRQVYRYNSAHTFAPIVGFSLMILLTVAISLISG